MMYAIVSPLESCGAAVSCVESCSEATGAVVSSAIYLPSASGVCQKRYNFILNRSGHASLAIFDIHDHFTPYANFRPTNSRLNGITGRRDRVPHAMYFQ